jgi:hypothetical protein
VTPDTIEILNDLRDQIRDLRTTNQEILQSTAALKNSMKLLLGNGQPGLISKLQDEVKELQRWRWRMVGIAVGVAAVFSGIVTTVTLLLKG